MQKNRLNIRTIAAAAAVGLALTTGAVGAAGAVDGQGAPLSEQTIATIDHNATGSITVHKRDLRDATPVDPTGNPDQTAPGEALAGATFQLYRVSSADLTTNAGFAAARGIDVRTIPTSELEAVGVPQTTPANGVLTFGDLPVGVYVLREIKAPIGFVPAADSLIFVPMTNPEDTTRWNYDIHVYPKNSGTSAEKKVEDAGRNVGDEVTYTITSDIPNLVNPATTVAKYEVRDDLDETRLASDAAKVSVALTDGPALTAGTDYQVTVDPDTLEARVVFLQPGREKLTAAKAANSTTQVVTTINATVTAIGNGGWRVENDAEIISNNGGGGGDTTTPTDSVESYWGKLRVNKSGVNGQALKDATFQLYTCTDQDNLQGPLTVNGKDSWTTDADGTFTIDALNVTDFRNGVEITADQQYCLVETKAPEGYELLPDPVEINFTRADIAATDANVAGDDDITLVAEIENVRTSTASLPLTGGAGVGLLAALGALILGAGAWVARRMSRG